MGCDTIDSISNFKVYYNYVHDATQTGNGDNEYGIYFGAIPTSRFWPELAYMRYNRVENINTWEGYDFHAGNYIYIQDNYLKQFGKTGILIGNDDSVEGLSDTCNHIWVERNTIEQPSSGWVTGSETAFIFACPWVAV